MGSQNYFSFISLIALQIPTIKILQTINVENLRIVSSFHCSYINWQVLQLTVHEQK